MHSIRVTWSLSPRPTLIQYHEIEVEAVGSFVHDAVHVVNGPAPVEAEGEVALELEFDAEAGADEGGGVVAEGVAAVADDVADIHEGAEDQVPVGGAENLLRGDAEGA